MAQQDRNINIDESIQEVIEKAARVEKLKSETADDRKQITHIQRSRTWKIMKPIRKLRHFFMKLIGLEKTRVQADYIQHLENQVAELESNLLEAKEELNTRAVDAREFNSQQMIDLLREKKEDGTLLDYLDQTIDQRKKHLHRYNKALIYASRLFMHERTDQKNLVYSKVLNVLNREEIPEFMIRAGLSEEDPLPLTQVASFRGSLSERVRQKQLRGTLPEYTLEDKQAAYQFVDQIGVRRPQATEGTFSLVDLPKETKTVVKPVDGAGSRGVYLIYELNDIIDIKRSMKLTSLRELEENMQKDLTLGWVAEDKWMSEELILENSEERQAASDLKFYTFYGKVGLILEISRFPERKHCWWTATGERIRTGKYEEQLFKGAGVTDEEIKLVEQMSQSIPAPFVRIDFLRSETGLVFGEFTAKPGNYDEFDDQTDEWLGDYFIEAEAKLTQDLLVDKNFTEYMSFIKKQGYSMDKHATSIPK